MPRYPSIEMALKKIDDEIHKVINRSYTGMNIIQKKIHTDMLSISPTIPKDTGNLRASYFAVNSRGTIHAGGAPTFSNENKDAEKLGKEHDRAVKEALKESETLAKYMIDGKRQGAVMIMGFSAYYRFWVHENYGAHFTERGSGAGFFSAAVNRNIGFIRSTLVKTMRKPK